MTTNGEAYFHIICFFMLSIISVPLTILNYTLITIDTVSKQIIFKNIFINSVRTYDFNELQGYVTSSHRDKYGMQRVIYLVKDEKRVERITELSYSNYDELLEGLSSLNYFGNRIFYWYPHMKILFRMTVFN